MGTRRGDDALEAQVEHVLESKSRDIARLLADYRVPTVPIGSAAPQGDDD